MKKARFLLIMSVVNLITLSSCFNFFPYPTSEMNSSSESTSESVSTSEVSSSTTEQTSITSESTTTSESTITPTSESTSVPTSEPTSVSTSEPTSQPTSIPTSEPSQPTSEIPSSSSTAPSTRPTSEETSTSSSSATIAPTSVPTSTSTSAPTSVPTSVPTSQSTSSSTSIPTSTSVSTSQSTSTSEISSSTSQSSSTSESSSSTSIPVDPYEIIETPAKRMPAEFEPQSMIKMCYPNNMPLSVYKTIAEDNKVLLLVNPNYSGNSRINAARNALQNAGVNIDNITFLDMPIDDDNTYWVRDFSPFYVFNNYDLSIVDFTYNRPYRTEQNAVPSKLATYFNMSYSKMNITHTGGNLMQDGRGTAFSDDLVVQENSYNESNVRSKMEQYTGTDNYVITIDPQGDYIAHIDCWAKIVAPDKIIVAKLPKSNSRYQYYEQVASELGSLKCVYGYNYRIYRVEEPGGDTIAPYTNSLIANNHVYMPLGENSSYNEKALQVYRDALPGYEVVGVEGYDFSNYECFLNTDALHCRTHEVPDQNMLFIDSREVYNDYVEYKTEYLIKTNIVSYAKADILDENVKIHYSINNGEYITSEMSRYLDTTNFTFKFNNLNHGDDVKYYIDAIDEKSNYNVDPTCGNLDPHHFIVL